jgi:hypothetical protein
MSPLALPCGLQDVYIWWTKLTAVKYGNKSAKHTTRTVGPPGAHKTHVKNSDHIQHVACGGKGCWASRKNE